ncbi:MAG: hypothetical protein ACI4MT_05575 [Christensenellales bacterium]
MKINELTEKLNANVVNLVNGDAELTTGYCGDFLSFVMGKAPSGCAWFTVMTNVNVCAVATLAEIGLIVVCEGSKCTPELIAKVKEQGVNVVETELDVFEAVKKYLE